MQTLLSGIGFVAPYALLLMPVGLVLGAVAFRVRAQKRRRWLAFLNTASEPALPSWRLEALAWTFSWVCLTLALARPFVGYTVACAPMAQKVCYLAVDVSRSMQAADLGPSRLDQVKRALQETLETLKALQGTGLAIGLIAFGGVASCECPPTQDYPSVLRAARQLSAGSAGKGTDLAAPIAWVLGTSPSRDSAALAQSTAGMLVILSDGEGKQPALSVLKRAAQQGWVIHTVGVGTAAGGSIPVPGGGAQSYLRDATGKVVITRLQADALQSIAQAAGGVYRPLDQLSSLIPFWAQGPLAPQETRLYRVPREYSAWPIVLGMLPLVGLMLAQAGFLPWRKDPRKAFVSKRSPTTQAPKPLAHATPSRPLASKVGCILLAWVMFCPSGSQAQPHWAQLAQQAYKGGDYAVAYQAYVHALQQADCGPGHPDYPVVCYNAGTAAYQAGQYAQALHWLQQAQSAASDLSPQAQASLAYNLGNACCRAGQRDRQHQEALWQNALQHYQKALLCWPGHPFAAANALWVKRQLKALCHSPQSAVPPYDHRASAQEAWLQALEGQHVAAPSQSTLPPSHLSIHTAHDW